MASILEEDTFLRLSKGDMKGKTKSEVMAAQDQALQTKYHVTKILQTEKDSKYRLGKQLHETQCDTSCQHAKYWQQNDT